MGLLHKCICFLMIFTDFLLARTQTEIAKNLYLYCGEFLALTQGS